MIPVVLLMWFAMMSTQQIAQAQQLANYAAFASCRTYATSHSLIGADDAESRAKNAVYLIMAPVSHAQPGEGAMIFSSIRDVVTGLGIGLVDNLYGLAEGFVVAYIYRVKDLTITAPSPSDGIDSVVQCTFDYYVPMSIPGFVAAGTEFFGLWDWHAQNRPGDDQTALGSGAFELGGPLGAASTINNAVNEIMDALNQIDAVLGGLGFGGVTGGIQSAVNSVISAAYSTGIAGHMYNFKVSARGVCGNEPWSGTLRTDDGASGYCSGDPPECMEGVEQAQQGANDAFQVAEDECNDVPPASNRWANAVAVFDNCMANCPSNNTSWCRSVHCNSERVDMETKEATLRQESDECDDAQQVAQQANDDIENALNDCN